jgi:hypothetical protein
MWPRFKTAALIKKLGPDPKKTNNNNNKILSASKYMVLAYSALAVTQHGYISNWTSRLRSILGYQTHDPPQAGV